MNRAESLDLAQIVLQASTADQTEVLILDQESALTRYAENVIHQNVAETTTEFSVRAVVGQRVGVASGTDLSPAGLRQLAADAVTLARLSAPDEGFVSLPEPLPLPENTDFADAATADAGPEDRAAGVRQVLEIARANRLRAAGAFTTRAHTITVANSLGVAAWQRLSGAELSVIMQGADSSGYARTASAAVGDVDPAALAQTAADKALASAHPREVAPGAYRVVLEEAAVGDMLMMLAFYDLGAQAVEEGRSFLSGHLGEPVCGANISLWDDGLDPRTERMAFDFEGVPKQRVDLIKDGIGVGAVWDSYNAHKAGRASTGHALPAPNTWGPLPLNLVLAPGDSSVPAMIANLERGLLVTRFHYTNMIHPIKTTLTGMTRDGTFLIEDGKLVGGVKNLRFTQSILEALSCVQALSATGKQTEYVWAPAAQVEAFNFSSGTEF